MRPPALAPLRASSVIEVVHGLCGQLRGQPATDFDHRGDPLPAQNRRANEAVPDIGSAGSRGGHTASLPDSHNPKVPGI
ncbi:hypothetical protein GCM10010532_013930 [Dactylosporangium siamense]|uniref:Uncharacterized protein n=1 Tax=Dactylosporangium siamense TaxID=685454 RepID=A0A919U7Y6_9ACTN|nr:hypothetical protein Dsi01nite_002460 [Dactylosporangium siamense]